MCGKNDQLEYLISLERLNAQKVANGIDAEWHPIEIEGGDAQGFTPRAQTFAVGVSETEIMILGGYASELQMDGYIYDAVTKTVRKEYQTDDLYGLSSYQNQCMVVKKGQVAICDLNSTVHLVKY